MIMLDSMLMPVNLGFLCFGKNIAAIRAASALMLL
jgi:hypothetical protein